MTDDEDRWSERQRAMLRELGVHLPPPGRRADAAGDVATLEPPAMAAARSPAPPVPAAAAPTAPDQAPAAPSRSPATGSAAPTRPVAVAPVAVRADWLVVVERSPIAAPAGAGADDETELLDNMLRAIGLQRAGAAAPADPGRSACVVDASAIGANGAEGANRPNDANDTTALASLLDVVAPRLVLCLGRQAARVVLGRDEPPGRLRGQLHRAADRVPAIVSWPPAYLLRQPDEKAKAWADLCLAVASLEG